MCFYGKIRKKIFICMSAKLQSVLCLSIGVCLFVLRFYGPVNPMGSC